MRKTGEKSMRERKVVRVKRLYVRRYMRHINQKRRGELGVEG